jgi:hypothetical protein
VRLAVTENQTSLVQNLVRREGHLQVVPHTHQQNTSFRQIYCRLSDNLIEQLVVQTFTNWTDSTLSRLLLDEFGVERALQLLQLRATGVSSAHV